MDDLDQRIIAILQEDGRETYANLSRRLKVSEGTVKRRLLRLVQSGTIHVRAIADPVKLGYPTTALVGLQVEPARIEGVADRLATLPETEYVAITTGAYDLFVLVHVASPEALATLLHTKVGPTPGVVHTETFVNLDVKKKPTF